MNEITIDQGIGFITGNWFWMLPAFLSFAFAAGGIIHLLGCICYYYVFREEAEEGYIDRVVPPLVKMGLLDEKYNCKWEEDRFERVIICMVVIYPALLSVLSFVIHIMPLWFLYSMLSTWGVLFAMRMGVDATKKAKSVLEALNLHKKEKDAHK